MEIVLLNEKGNDSGFEILHLACQFYFHFFLMELKCIMDNGQKLHNLLNFILLD
jgi:hypothetical protein